MAKKTRYGYEKEDFKADKLNYFDENAKPELTEESKQRSEELIAMLDKKMATKRKKKLFSRDGSGNIKFEDSTSMKGIFKAIGYGALIVGFCLILVLVFSVKTPLNVQKIFQDTVHARVLNISGNEGMPYQPKEYDIKDFTGNREGEKQRYRNVEFALKSIQQIYLYSVKFSVKTEGTGYFAYIIRVKDDNRGENGKVVMKNVLVEKAGKELKFEVVIDATLYGDITISFEELYIGDGYSGGETMDESIGKFSIYKVKFLK